MPTKVDLTGARRTFCGTGWMAEVRGRGTGAEIRRILSWETPVTFVEGGWPGLAIYRFAASV